MVRDWRGMRNLASRLLEESTGENLDAWNRKIELEGPADEKILRLWLGQRGVTGFTQSYLVVEKLGNPDDLAVTGPELIDGQYADRPALRAVYDALIAAATAQGDVTVQAHRTYVLLYSPLRVYARVESPSPDRIELQLRLDKIPAGGRLEPSTVHENLPVRIVLRSPGDLDAETLAWLQQAYVENC